MKVAFFVAHFPVLSEPFILNQIVGTIERGHEVDIYSLDGIPQDTSKLHPLVEQYHLMERTIYAPTRPDNELWRWIKGLSLLLINFHKNPSVCLQLLNTSCYVSQAKSLKMLYRALPFLKTKSYDIIHCQFSTLGVFGVWFRQLGLIEGKLISTFRGSDISKFLPKWGEQVYQELFQETDFFLANCEFFKDKAVALGCDADKIHVHGSGIDSNSFFFQERSYPHDGIIRIATTGRLVEKKGIEYVIKAVAQVIKNYPDIEYNIIGDGELKTHFEKLIFELNLSQNVKLLGWKQQKEIVDILDKCHIFVAPSVTGKDGNQDAPVNTLKEAMAMGLPVISTRHGGIPELVTDGVSGFLVPERDAEAIAHKLTYLIEHPELWKKMGKAGRGRVEEKYDMNKLNDELVEIYQQMLNSASPQQDFQHLPKELTAI
ncbi:glycosyltransferase [Anabaena sp. FACHB-709]|uniref:Glycosyltransferase n=2 Tax=Nostocaceae TaxID=1162 RepID=A0A1Z4KP78_ANAVA|nr:MULTISPECIES: glycosyltransferase [Nostocaceae]BAY70800.1 glycosyltransferase [Trichormus variabilis NIES-23]MBD2171209.1 glycosyltransferase [Anabaena cylindrica FACHB-318]MBD2263121.1 glycosyltransferase [Anabaena sp. FACHB-709]MBD2272536.1 glycosyltransferase [Nostoc sp. PCC 7120 = FACHB-418]MBD2283720.1 glycosyltransferase [Anabaena cylindrica FACHB-170]